jgi:hypothetical protein
MTDAVIFAVGSLVFIFTAWATFAFGLSRFGELQRRDQPDDDATVVRLQTPWTEVRGPETGRRP